MSDAEEKTRRPFIRGAILGRLITGGLTVAGTFYDFKGQPAAPRGSAQQFDDIRQRQHQLDITHMRE
ncbi:MAG: hypothetical protein H8K03_22355 (plasmid) [Nitrospira sp.]